MYSRMNVTLASCSILLIIISDAFSNVLNSCLDQAFAVFYRHAFAEPLVDDNQAATKKTTLANLLPGVSRQAHLVISGNEYLNVRSERVVCVCG